MGPWHAGQQVTRQQRRRPVGEIKRLARRRLDGLKIRRSGHGELSTAERTGTALTTQPRLVVLGKIFIDRQMIERGEVNDATKQTYDRPTSLVGRNARTKGRQQQRLGQFSPGTLQVKALES